MSDRPSDQELEEHVAKATETLALLRNGHAAFHELEASAPGKLYTYKGAFTFAALFVWTQIKTNAPVTFSDGTTRSFLGNCYGVGLGGGISWGGGSFSVAPSDLGDCRITVAISSIVVTIEFWRNGVPIGSFVGGGLGVGATTGAGSGTWS